MGQAGFFAIGGYAAAFLTTFDLTRFERAAALLGKAHLLVTRGDGSGGTITHVHPWAAALVAIGIAAAVAWIVAGPVFRLRGHYLAMATLGFGIIVHCICLAFALRAADGISTCRRCALLGFAVTGRAAPRVSNYYVPARLCWRSDASNSSARGSAALGDPRLGKRGRRGRDPDRLQDQVCPAAFWPRSPACCSRTNGGIGPPSLR
jgi:hypothetical protein